VQGIENAIKNIILPLQTRADKLAQTVEPTVDKLNAASERAAQLWPRRIWTMALTCGAIVGLSIAALGIGFSYWKLKRHYDTALAEQITSEASTLKQNQKAFTALAFLTHQFTWRVAPIHKDISYLIPTAFTLKAHRRQTCRVKSAGYFWQQPQRKGIATAFERYTSETGLQHHGAMKHKRQRLASFCSCRYPSHPDTLSTGRSTRKTSQDFGLGRRRGETGFLPDIQKPVSPR